MVRVHKCNGRIDSINHREDIPYIPVDWGIRYFGE